MMRTSGWDELRHVEAIDLKSVSHFLWGKAYRQKVILLCRVVCCYMYVLLVQGVGLSNGTWSKCLPTSHESHA